MDKYTLKVGDKVSCDEFSDEVWAIGAIRGDTFCVIVSDSSNEGWTVTNNSSPDLSNYMGYRGWNIPISYLTLVRKANPIWLKQNK